MEVYCATPMKEDGSPPLPRTPLLGPHEVQERNLSESRGEEGGVLSVRRSGPTYDYDTGTQDKESHTPVVFPSLPDSSYDKSSFFLPSESFT